MVPVDVAMGDGSSVGIRVDTEAVPVGVTGTGVKVPVGRALSRVASLLDIGLGGEGDGVELGAAPVDVSLCEGRVALGS